jgi:penicillin-insensitive murein endopeptidase
LAVFVAACFPSGVRPASLAFTALTALLTLAVGAFSETSPQAAGARHERTASMTAGPLTSAALRFGRSVGSPTAGHLLGGLHLVETEYLRVEPDDMPGDVRWGLEPLVLMLDRAARSVRHQFPATVTSVGHLSRDGGGDIGGHRSHESGRDADVGYFVRGQTGKQLLAPHFVAFRADGTAPSWPGAYFDDAKNWTLVSSMIADPEARVTHVFVASWIRARLLAYAEHSGAPVPLRLRAAELMQQPRGALPHDDHFHVRIGCPPHQNGCVENPGLRVHSTPSLLAHGHRLPASRSLVTPAPRRGLASTPAPDQERDGPRAPLENTAAPADTEPVEPPALLMVPVDDVDG